MSRDGVTPGCLWNGDAYKVQPSIFVYTLDAVVSTYSNLLNEYEYTICLSKLSLILERHCACQHMSV